MGKSFNNLAQVSLLCHFVMFLLWCTVHVRSNFRSVWFRNCFYCICPFLVLLPRTATIVYVLKMAVSIPRQWKKWSLTAIFHVLLGLHFYKHQNFASNNTVIVTIFQINCDIRFQQPSAPVLIAEILHWFLQRSIFFIIKLDLMTSLITLLFYLDYFAMLRNPKV